MIKRIFSLLLVFCIINFMSLPVFAHKEEINKVINAEFKTELNVNKASKGQVVQFVSDEDCVVEGFTIPAGTIFNGEIKHFKQGRWAYRRAKAVIKINEMILPNGETYKIKAVTKRHVLKGSALANIGKGIISFPFAIVAGVAGSAVIIVEIVSIAGIIIVGPTALLFGDIVGKLTNGINYKKHEGDSIKLRLKSIRVNNSL